MLQDIDLLTYKSFLRQKTMEDGLSYLFDPVRRRYVRGTPEELVRQLWIQYFLQELKLQPKLIAVERLFIAHGKQKRFDLVIFDKSTLPVLIAEFKAPGVNIAQSVFDQVVVYNLELQVPYALISNGKQHFCFETDPENRGFRFLNSLPFGV